ncbi:MAG: response regulator [Ignavibacteria bacterium]|nr:response regulator [Ignavibacteria bacterium]
MEKTQKILIVDDEHEVLDLCVAALSSAGTYTIRTATHPQEAMRIAEEFRPALVVSDYYMPEMNGFELCAWVKAHPELSDTLFMVLTGAAETQHKIRGLDTGADEYMTKPFSTAEFISRVNALLRTATLQQQLKDEHAELVRLLALLNQSFRGIVTLITHIIGLRVPNATARAQSAADFARWIGDRLGINGRHRENLEIAALIHEVGKIGMPDEILMKRPSDLTPQERDRMDQFPLFGQLLVGSVPQLESVAGFLRHQLENFDGTGSPDKLRKEQIPLISRILRAINLVQSLTGSAELSADELVQRIRSTQGTLLDPHIVQLLVEYLQVSQSPSWHEGKKQVGVEQLEKGMVLAIDLCTGSGMKLLPRNSTLTESNIRRILTLHQTDPIINEIYVYEAPQVHSPH